MSNVADTADRSAEWQRRGLAHLWPHGDDAEWEELSAAGGLDVFAEGRGSTLIDVDGKEFIDGLAGLFLVNVGHGRKEIADAMAEQAARLAYTAASNVANTTSVALAEELASITPEGLDRIFLCSGGSEAIESAMKIAKQNQILRGYPKRTKMICRRGSYHGTTGGAMALTVSASERYFGPFMPGVSKVPSPNHYRPEFSEPGESEDLRCADAVEQEILALGPEYVAAVIGEPISVSNGTHIPSAAYWRRIREICDRYEVYLIFDEVVTGFGRTGQMFASDTFGVIPDLMTMAKGLSSGYAPAGAVAVAEHVFAPFTVPGNSLNHLLTFGGNAVSSAACRRNIQILVDEDLAGRSAERGSQLYAEAQKLLTHRTVGDVRGGTGLMCAIELVKDKQSKTSWGTGSPFIKRLRERLHELGLVTRVWDVLHLAPPLVVTQDEVRRIIEIIDSALTDCECEFADEIA